MKPRKLLRVGVVLDRDRDDLGVCIDYLLPADGALVVHEPANEYRNSDRCRDV